MNSLHSTPGRLLQHVGLAAAACVLVGLTACKSNQNANQAQIASQDQTGSVDPAYANLAPGAGGATSTGQPTSVLGESQSYTPQQSAAEYNNGNPGDDAYNDYDADTAYEANEPPPPIPDYDQPPAPGPDWYWTPGYWAWGDSGYYWVPGTWVEPPYYGALWTPPYWGWYGGHYLFHRGYWGPHVGFYGGIDYGFGYVGIGYFGGYWQGHNFYYNRSVTNVGGVGYYYNRPVVVDNVHYGAQPVNRVSYNGGRGGIATAPRPQEMAARSERHAQPVAAQTQLRETAAHDPAYAYNTNHGRPEHAAFARPEAAGVNVAHPNEARPGQPMNEPANRPGVNPAENQRNTQMQQRTAEMQQRNNQLQQHNNEARQRNAEMAQHNNEVQRNTQLQHNEAAQRNQQMAQHNAQMQQHNNVMQQHNNEAAQRNAEMAQHREQPQQHEAPRPEQRAEAPRPQPEQRMEAPRPQPQQRAEAPRPAPHVEAPRPAPHAEAPHPAPHPAGSDDHGHR